MFGRIAVQYLNFLHRAAAAHAAYLAVAAVYGVPGHRVQVVTAAVRGTVARVAAPRGVLPHRFAGQAVARSAG